MINIIIILSLFSRACTDKAPVEFFIFTFHTIQKYTPNIWKILLFWFDLYKHFHKWIEIAD